MNKIKASDKVIELAVCAIFLEEEVILKKNKCVVRETKIKKTTTQPSGKGLPPQWSTTESLKNGFGWV